MRHLISAFHEISHFKLSLLREVAGKMDFWSEVGGREILTATGLDGAREEGRAVFGAERRALLHEERFDRVEGERLLQWQRIAALPDATRRRCACMCDGTPCLQPL